ncbi:MAG: tripartite tricarboxylate transporter substrate-binding protein, partial [Alcaligenaceae bacterium]
LSVALLWFAVTLSPISAAYPERPITLIVTYPPGGTADLVARLLAPEAGKDLGQNIVVENRGGAGGMIGGALVAKAAPDGYTIMLDAANHAQNPAVQPKMLFDTLKDFAPIVYVQRVPNILVVRADNEMKTVADLIRLGKQKDPLLYYASSGPGGAQHLAGEELQQLGQFKLTHVPYKGGGPAVPDLVSGNVDVGFLAVATVASLVQSGKLKALGVSPAKSLALLAQVPPVGQSISGFDVEPWLALIAPANLPKAVAEKLKIEVEAAIKNESFQAFIQQQGSPMKVMTIDELKRFFADESRKNGDLVRMSGAKLQ